MKNTKLRRTLSILLSIIMIMTTCAIAFGVSAEEDGETILANAITALNDYVQENNTVLGDMISGTGTFESMITLSAGSKGNTSYKLTETSSYADYLVVAKAMDLVQAAADAIVRYDTTYGDVSYGEAWISSGLSGNVTVAASVASTNNVSTVKARLQVLLAAEAGIATSGTYVTSSTGSATTVVNFALAFAYNIKGRCVAAQPRYAPSVCGSTYPWYDYTEAATVVTTSDVAGYLEAIENGEDDYGLTYCLCLTMVKYIENGYNVAYFANEGSVWSGVCDSSDLLGYYTTSTDYDTYAALMDTNASYIGSCGDGVNYAIDFTTGTLYVFATGEGTGAMTDFSAYTATPWYSNISSITSVVVCEGVTHIGNHSFRLMSKVTSLTLPEYSLESIGTYSFLNMALMTGELVIPDSVTSIGAYAFHKTPFTSIVIGSGVTAIENYTFASCAQLVTVSLPASIETVGDYAFNACTALTAVYYGGSAADITISTSYNDPLFSAIVYNHVCSGGELLEEITASTCGTYGTGYYKCADCSRIYVGSLTEYGSAHTYSDTPDVDGEVVAATCTQGTGYTYTCSVCQQSEVFYDDDIDPDAHTGVERKYIDDDGNVLTYWTCCQTTSYLTDLAELILDNWATVADFATNAPVLYNQLDASGYLSRTFTVDDYDTYIAVAEIAELTIYVLQEIVENSEAGYTGTTINSTSNYDFDIWSTYKINYDPDEGIQALLKAEIASLIADSSSDYYGFSGYSASTITNFYQYFVPGANDTSSSPTQKALATLSTFQDNILIDVIITTTDSSGYYGSGTTYADLSTTTTMSFNMDLVTTVYNGQSYSVEGLRSAAAMSIKTTTESSFSSFESAADAYIAAVTAFNAEYSTAAALYAAGDEADDSAITSAATALATYGVDVETLFADNTQYNAYTAKLAAIAEHEDGHSTYEGATVAATCCSSGYTQTLCHDCNFVSYTYTGIDEDAHLYSTEEQVVIAPTCTEDGYTVEYWYCCQTIDDATVVGGSTVVSPGHSYVTTEYVAATCNTYSSTTEVCATCGKDVITEGTEYDENTHVYDDGVFTDGATCTDNGYTTFTCTNEYCDAFYTVDEVGADHVYELTESVEATCTEDGYDLYECTCGESYKDEYPTTGHNFFYPISTTAGDCGHKATTTYECAYCDETLVREGDYDYSIHVDTDGDGTCDCGASDGTSTPEPDVDDDGDDDDDSSSSSGSSSLSFWDSIVAAFQNFFAMIAALFTF